MTKRLAGMVVALAAAFAPGLDAQGEGGGEVDIKELARQIHRNMKKVEQDLAAIDGTESKAKAEQVKADMDKLINSMKGRGTKIVLDMDELVKNWPC